MIKTPETNTTSSLDHEERIRELAYQMWEDEGRPEGRAESHWEQACLVVMTTNEDAEIESPEWLTRQETKAETPKLDIPKREDSRVEDLKRRTIHRSAA